MRSIWVVTSQPSEKFLEVFETEALALGSIGTTYSRLHVAVEKVKLQMGGWEVKVEVHDEGMRRTDTFWVRQRPVYDYPEHL